jgi:hypothetical protein
LNQHEIQIINNIHHELQLNNRFLRTLRQHLEIPYENGVVIQNITIPTFDIVIDDNISNIPDNAHPRTYNLPTTTECSVLIPGVGGEADAGKQRNITIRLSTGGLQNIESSHSAYDPLSYAITHSHADKGWSYDLYPKLNQLITKNDIWNFLNNNNNNAATLKYVTARDFYCYRFQRREDWVRNPITQKKILHPNDNIMRDTLLYGGILFQQFVISCWIKIEEQRLLYIYCNQANLKIEQYHHLANAVRANESRLAGKYIVLPSSFIGSPRQRFNSYQDAMAIVRKYGKPDIFLTFTANPDWIEIKNELTLNAKSYMCPDVIARIFRIKLKELIHDIEYKLLFGLYAAQIHVIEFQKRGLPHSHILVFLKHESKLRTTIDYDEFISAEIPDPALHPTLHNIVIKNMIHTCAVGRCKKNQTDFCSKKFPKEFCDNTIFHENSYPIYRRRNKHPFTKIVNRNETTITDRNVVPYNPYLLKKYNCHLNVEIASTIKTVKYICKYVYKGHDKALVRLRRANNNLPNNNNNDQQQLEPGLIINEVKSYQDCRYVGPMEAIWRIYGNYMHSKYPNVECLAIHLPNEHSIVYMEGNEADALRINADACTTLTEYFATVSKELLTPLTIQQLGKDKVTNIVYPAAFSLKYHDFPSYYSFHNKEWKRRTKPHCTNTIGRIASVHPNAGECFYLRLLLTHTIGASSFNFLKQDENGIVQETFKQVHFYLKFKLLFFMLYIMLQCISYISV